MIGLISHHANIVELPKLLRKEDQVIFADAGYTSDDYKKGSRHSGLSWCVNGKRKPGKTVELPAYMTFISPG